MTRWNDIEQQLREHLALRRAPVAIAFLERPPRGVPRLSETVPSTCSFWRLAGDGRVFFTEPADHYNCPIGAYTHGISLPSDRASELDRALALMAEVGYLRMDEVPEIPRLEETPGIVVFAPLGSTPVDPDVVALGCRPDKLMLLMEAAGTARVPAASPLMGRPTCMAIPATMPGGMTLSAGCIGNRVYTDLPVEELYAFVSGRDLAKLAEGLAGIVQANLTLAEYHRERRRQIETR